MIGKFRDHKRADKLPYQTLTLDQLKTLPVRDFAADNSHLWLWTTSRSLRDGYDLAQAWGFKVLSPITWVKPSGMGAWWISRTQVMLHCYRGKLDMKSRYHPNVMFANSQRHSQKPECAYELIEKVSHPEYLEIFARNTRPGWTSWGNEITGEDIMAKDFNDTGRSAPTNALDSAEHQGEADAAGATSLRPPASAVGEVVHPEEPAVCVPVRRMRRLGNRGKPPEISRDES